MANEIKQLFIAQGCVIVNNKVLLIKRNEPNNKEIHNNWELPGGKVKFGEPPQKAAIREIKEETGVIVYDGILLDHIYQAVRKVKTTSNTKKIQPIIFCYVCKPKSLNLNFDRNEKIIEVKWFSLKEINPFKLQSGSFEFIKKGVDILEAKNLTNSDEFEAMILMKKIDKKLNQEKFWKLTIIGNFLNDEVFHVRTNFGRIRKSSHQQNKLMKGRTELIKFLNNKLAEKNNKGYMIVKKSENFPYIERLESFKYSKKDFHQLTLF